MMDDANMPMGEESNDEMMTPMPADDTDGMAEVSDDTMTTPDMMEDTPSDM